MAKKIKEKSESGQDRKSKLSEIIASVVALLAAIAVIVVVAVLINKKDGYDESYFVTDDKKIVIELKPNTTSLAGGGAEFAGTTYIVYYRDGNKITDAKVFFDCGDEETTKSMYEEALKNDASWVKNMSQSGEYLVVQANADQYKGLTVEDLESQIESLRAAGMIVEGDGDSDENTEVEGENVDNENTEAETSFEDTGDLSFV